MGKENSGNYLVYVILMVVAIFLVYFLMQFSVNHSTESLVLSEPEKTVIKYSCEKSGDSKVTCKWSGCYGDSVVVLQKGDLIYSWMLDTSSGKHDFDILDSGNYRVVFVCGNQTRIMESIYIENELT
ncbi:MAG: hypothetical protein KAT28_01430 [Candidatus Aenigmarchaeota archaeon]|nr:hypothetical protein [Candidatus Aenigmarchaeota archaeon]